MSQRPYLVLLIFLLIALAILAPLVPQFGTSLIYPAHSSYSDLTITHWPAFAYTRDQLQTTGQIPLWRTSILLGTPFAADPLSGRLSAARDRVCSVCSAQSRLQSVDADPLHAGRGRDVLPDAAVVDRAGRGVDRRVCVCGLAQDHRAHGRGARHAGRGMGVGAARDCRPQSPTP